MMKTDSVLEVSNKIHTACQSANSRYDPSLITIRFQLTERLNQLESSLNVYKKKEIGLKQELSDKNANLNRKEADCQALQTNEAKLVKEKAAFKIQVDSLIHERANSLKGRRQSLTYQNAKDSWIDLKPLALYTLWNP
jgi:chromosome segregation ATPase